MSNAACTITHSLQLQSGLRTSASSLSHAAWTLCAPVLNASITENTPPMVAMASADSPPGSDSDSGMRASGVSHSDASASASKSTMNCEQSDMRITMRHTHPHTYNTSQPLACTAARSNAPVSLDASTAYAVSNSEDEDVNRKDRCKPALM
jgi:hypothetical protein